MAPADGEEFGPRKRGVTIFCSFEGCSKTFNRPSRLLAHLRAHTCERPYTCDVEGCGKSYARLYYLKRHTDLHHKDPDKSLEVTSKSLPTSPKAPTVYKCPEPGCTKEYSKRHRLADHTRLVHQEASLRCDRCSFKCTYPSQLRRHNKRHQGYPCPVDGCTAEFETWSALLGHKKLHKDATQKAHQCPVCSKSFPSKAAMLAHSDTHNAEREVIGCTEEGCDRTFFFLRNLRHHVAVAHQGRRFPCSHCGKQLFSKASLRKHEHKLHGPESGKQKSPKKYPKKGHRKVPLVTRLTGVPMDVTLDTLQHTVVLDTEEHNVTVSSETAAETVTETTTELTSDMTDMTLEKVSECTNGSLNHS